MVWPLLTQTRHRELHDELDSHKIDTGTARVWPKLYLSPHRAALVVTPSLVKIGAITDFAGINTLEFQGTLGGGRQEGYEGYITIAKAPYDVYGEEEELVIVIKYLYEQTVGAKASYFELAYRIVNLDTGFITVPPPQRQISALLTDPGAAPSVPAEYVYRENRELRIPSEFLQDNDIIIIDRILRDHTNYQETNDDVYVIEFSLEVQPETLEDARVYMFEGADVGVVVAQGASVTTPVTIDVESPGVFDKQKGILELVSVVGTGGIQTSTDFDVEIFTDVAEADMIYQKLAEDSSVGPWFGLYDYDVGLPFENSDSPKEKKLYVKITNNVDPATPSTFDILLRGPELK